MKLIITESISKHDLRQRKQDKRDEWNRIEKFR